jgi:hypothetical protein
MHQLVRQLVEGAMLAKLIGKEFMQATLGCGPDRVVTLQPAKTEMELLNLVGAACQSVPNLSWDFALPVELMT